MSIYVVTGYYDTVWEQDQDVFVDYDRALSYANEVNDGVYCHVEIKTFELQFDGTYEETLCVRLAL